MIEGDEIDVLCHMLGRPRPKTRVELDELIRAAEDEIVRVYEAADAAADFADAMRGPS